MSLRARGQATVEMALGSLVFITILVFGIHFSEVTWVGMKTQEAANAALWDATTGRQWHDFAFGYGQYMNMVTDSQLETQARYSDFDGRSSTGGAATVKEVFTNASNLQVHCDSNGFQTLSTMGTPLLYPVFRPWSNTGMSCSAEADVVAGETFPVKFMEKPNNFTFHVQEYTPTPIHVCALGRASGGTCAGRYPMMVDDWGLAGVGSNESNNCLGLPFGVPCPTNMNYWTANAIETGIAEVTSGFAWDFSGFKIMNWMGGWVNAVYLPDEHWPNLTFTGEELLFQQPMYDWDDFIPPFWQSTPSTVMPMYGIAYIQRSGCYLGCGCGGSGPCP